MKKIVTTFCLILFVFSLQAQSKRNDIPVSKLPSSVKQVLIKYVKILQSSQSLEDCAQNFVEVAGGSLVNEDGKSLRSSVKPYSLKKDFSNIKFYANPIKITRVNVSQRSSGFGESAIRGKVYKIWIDKKSGQSGMPAPISILVPEGHASIKIPKVIGIGSL